MSKPEIILNTDLDAKSLAKEYKKTDTIQIPNIMNEEAAKHAVKCMEKEIPWVLLYIDQGTLKQKTQNELAQQSDRRRFEMYTRIYEWARHNYQSLNYAFGLDTAHEQGQMPELFLHKVYDFLNSPEVLKSVMAITGEKGLTRATATATVHAADHFRNTHKNSEGLGNRRIGFTLDLSEDWHPNWGGYLQFYDEEQNIKKGYKPTFNSLTLYKEPQGSSVSYIPIFTGRTRVTLSGWFWAE